MRRALLTAAPPVATGFTVGDAGGNYGSTETVAGAYWTLANPAPRAGTLTTMNLALTAGAGAQVTPFTCTGSASSITITAVGAPMNVSEGQNVLAVSLPISSGGFVGYYTVYGTGVGAGYVTSSGHTYYLDNSGTAPSVGGVYTPAVTRTGRALCLNGTT